MAPPPPLPNGNGNLLTNGVGKQNANIITPPSHNHAGLLKEIETG